MSHNLYTLKYTSTIYIPVLYRQPKMTPCRHNHHGDQTGPVPNFRDSMAINVFILNWQTANCWDCWHPDCRHCTYLELIFKSFLRHYLKPSPDHLVSCGGGQPSSGPTSCPLPQLYNLVPLGNTKTTRYKFKATCLLHLLDDRTFSRLPSTCYTQALHVQFILQDLHSSDRKSVTNTDDFKTANLSWSITDASTVCITSFILRDHNQHFHHHNLTCTL